MRTHNSRCGQTPQLAALLNLLKIAALFIPTFVPVVVAPSGLPGSSDVSPIILTLMCNVVRGILPPKEDGLDDSQSDIAREVLGLLEAIVWTIPPEFAMRCVTTSRMFTCDSRDVLRLTAFFRAPDVLSVLINKDQPAWLLHRALRVFALIASCESVVVSSVNLGIELSMSITISQIAA